MVNKAPRPESLQEEGYFFMGGNSLIIRLYERMWYNIGTREGEINGVPKWGRRTL